MTDTGPRSGNSNVSVGVVFQNCTDESVSLYWYNGKGEKVSYGDIHPNMTKGMSTFETHPWTAIVSIIVQYMYTRILLLGIFHYSFYFTCYVFNIVRRLYNIDRFR